MKKIDMNEVLWKSTVSDDVLTTKNCLILLFESIAGIVAMAIGFYWLIIKGIEWLSDKISVWKARHNAKKNEE